MQPRRSVTYALATAAVALVAVGAIAMPRMNRPVAPPPVAPPPVAPPHVAPVPEVAKAPPAPAPEAPPDPSPARPRIEVVFALDTTGSMAGLLDGAKRTIWSLVDYMSQGQPVPEVRIGLVAYRDVGDRYVTRFFDLSDDVDEVFRQLSSLQADGGGDTPEHVARALHDAVNRTSWTAGQNVAKLIYLVGDAPPHDDYNDGFDAGAIARRAAKKGIRVNTIRCGDDSDASRAFASIARLGGGRFASTAQDGAVAVRRSPFDDKLAALNMKLMGTAVGYGAGRAALEGKMGALGAVGAASIADRAAYVARKGTAFTGDASADLLNAYSERGAPALLSARKEDLPADLRDLSPTAQIALLDKKKAERAEVLADMRKVSAERSAFMAALSSGTNTLDAAPRAPGVGALGAVGAVPPTAAPRANVGFDDEVRRTLKEQTKAVTTLK